MKSWAHRQNCLNSIWNIIIFRQSSSEDAHQHWSHLRRSMTSMNWSPNNARHVKKVKLHQVELRYPEFVMKFLDNLHLLIIEKWHKVKLQNYSFSDAMMAQPPWLPLTWRTQGLSKKRLTSCWSTLNLPNQSKIHRWWPSVYGSRIKVVSDRQNIQPTALGPGTPMPKRAEPAMPMFRMFKRHAQLILHSLSEDPRANITHRRSFDKQHRQGTVL